MPDPLPQRLDIAVAGGSIAGLCAGTALLSAGLDVHVFERSAERLSSRGAGIVVQPELLDLLNAVGAPPLATTRCGSRRMFDAPTGGVETTRMPQRFTSWEAIYAALRSAFPDDRYHLGCELALASRSGDGVELVIGSDRVDADLLVAADGIGSGFRSGLAPGTVTRYAGYIAWRGVVDESQLHPDLVDDFDDTFSFCRPVGGGHALCYLIPGDGPAVAPGRRRLNWVWYIPVGDDATRDALLTDRSGKRRQVSVPQGEIGDVARRFLLARTDLLAAPFATLVRATPDPFIQSIVDVAPCGMVFGRVCLVGDAAFVVRPHTAASAAKAAADAMALAQTLRGGNGDFDSRLLEWERQQVAVGRRLVDYGVMLGERTHRQPTHS